MNNALIIGWALNAIWLFHLVFKNKSTRLYKFIAVLILTIPYVGFIFYFIFYVWDVPPPSPLFMRAPDRYGYKNYGGSDRQERRRLRKFETEKGIEGLPRLLKKKSWLRVGFLLISLALILGGLKATLFGDGSYRNWWGGLVFGPAAIFMGLILIYFTTRTPQKKSDNDRVE
jgi:hypothetical protein